MASDVIVNFQVQGLARVQEAFRTIEQSTLRAERATVKSSQSSTRTREREYAALAKTAAKWSRDAVKETERAERDKAKAVERNARDRVSNMIKSDKMIVAAHKEAAREFERTEAEKNRRASIWLKKREREELESARRTMRARENFARATVGAAGRGLSAGMRAATSATMGVAGSMLSLGGGFSISDSVHRATAASGLAADISNSGFLPKGLNEANKKRRSTTEIQSVTRGAAAEYGLTNEDALSGLQEFTGLSGNLDQGMKLLPQLAQIARATGTSLDDLAEAAGNVSLNLPDDTDGEQTLHVIRKLAEGGKLGAVEMRDFAAQMAKVSAAAGKFAGNRVENIIKMGAIAQEARGEGGAFSASVAANSVSGFTSTLATSSRAAAFQAAKVNIFADEGHTQYRAPEDIIVDSLKATGGDKLKMNGLFKNVMGQRAIEGFSRRYTDAEAVQKGSGEAAVRGRMSELIGKTSPEELKKQFASDAAVRMQEADAKMAVVMANFDQAVAEKLVPKLLELMPVIEKLIPQFVELAARGVPAFVRLIKAVGDFADANKGIIQSLAEHPIGSIIAFELVKSIGGAGIGGVVRAAIQGAISGGAEGGTIGKVAGKVPGGAIAGAAGLGLAAFTGASIIDSASGGATSGADKVQQAFIALRKAREGVAGGAVSPEQARETARRVQAMISQAKDDTGGAGTTLAAVSAPLALVSSSARKDIANYNSQKEIADASDDLAKSLKRLMEAADLAAAAHKDAPIADPNAPNRTQPLTVPRN